MTSEYFENSIQVTWITLIVLFWVFCLSFWSKNCVTIIIIKKKKNSFFILPSETITPNRLDQRVGEKTPREVGGLSL